MIRGFVAALLIAAAAPAGAQTFAIVNGIVAKGDGSEPSPRATVPPVIAIVCAATGAAIAKSSEAMAERIT